MCQKVVDVLHTECTSLVEEGKTIASKYEKLLSTFGVCHFKFNSSKPMTDDEIVTLDQDIKEHINYFRELFPNTSFPPKLHMLEDHTIAFIKKWRFPLGFLGEQGGESIHHEFKDLERQFQAVKPETVKLQKCLEEH